MKTLSSLTIGNRFWEFEISFDKSENSNLISVHLSENGEGINNKTLLLVKVSKSNLIIDTCKLLVDYEKKIEGYNNDILVNNLDNLQSQLLQSCICQNDGVSIGKFFIGIDKNELKQFYQYSENILDKNIIQYITNINSFPYEYLKDEDCIITHFNVEDNFEDSIKTHRKLVGDVGFSLEKLIEKTESIIKDYNVKVFQEEKYINKLQDKEFIKQFGDEKLINSLDVFLSYYKKNNYKIPHGKLMNIVRIHNDLSEYQTLFLLESWNDKKTFPFVPSEWQSDNVNNSNGKNYFLKNLLLGKEKWIITILDKSNNPIHKDIKKRLMNLGKKELEMKQNKFHGMHKYVFGWMSKFSE